MMHVQRFNFMLPSDKICILGLDFKFNIIIYSISGVLHIKVLNNDRTDAKSSEFNIKTWTMS